MAWMAGCGAVLGASFDTIGVTARRFRFGSAVRAVLDVLYWVAATLFVFRVLLMANGGIVRPFVFLGLGIGAVLYMLLIGGWFRKFVDRLLRVLEWLFVRIYRLLRAIVWRPLRWIVMTVWRMVRWIARNVARISVSIGRIVLKWSRLVWERLIKRPKR